MGWGGGAHGGEAYPGGEGWDWASKGSGGKEGEGPDGSTGSTCRRSLRPKLASPSGVLKEKRRTSLEAFPVPWVGTRAGVLVRLEVLLDVFG